jgi:hypothetical protein
MNEQTEREHVKELIAYWPNEKFLVGLTTRQRTAALGMTLDDKADRFKRDSSPIVDMCDCKGANLNEYGVLPINNKHDPDAAFRMVRTIATVPGTCDFCKHTTMQVRESTLSGERVNKAKNEAAKRGNRIYCKEKVEDFVGKTYGYFTVLKGYVDMSSCTKFNKRGMRMLTVQCICGNVKEVKVTRFRTSKSCGCRAYEYHGNKQKQRTEEVANV